MEPFINFSKKCLDSQTAYVVVGIHAISPNRVMWSCESEAKSTVETRRKIEKKELALPCKGTCRQHLVPRQESNHLHYSCQGCVSRADSSCEDSGFNV